MQLSDFEYNLPPELIAQHPLAVRSASRLLCLNKSTGEIQHRLFSAVIELLTEKDLLVLNNTRVIPARLLGRKATGGQAEVLIERILDAHRVIAKVRASKSPKPGGQLLFGVPPTVGVPPTLALPHKTGGGDSEFPPPVLWGRARVGGTPTVGGTLPQEAESHYIFEVIQRHGEFFELYSHDPRPVLEVIEAIGHLPLPPYISRSPENHDQERYQTIYAQHKGSVAAPTAGLHFDDAIFNQLRVKGVSIGFLTLHVGAGTYTPVRTENIKEHRMHAEYLDVSATLCDQVRAAKQRGGRVVAVGTTAVRGLESASASGEMGPFLGETAIFIYPGYHYRCVDALITNFHLPGSSLLMLVSALGGYESVMRAYHEAIAQQYRFFSYGDAMWIG